jgi:hypothetical protein
MVLPWAVILGMGHCEGIGVSISMLTYFLQGGVPPHDLIMTVEITERLHFLSGKSLKFPLPVVCW